MDFPDRPLAASQKALRVFVEWGDSLRPRMMSILTDRAAPYHVQAGAVHLLRLPRLCEAIVLLNDVRLFDEAITVVRVAAELAITVAWIDKDDSKAEKLVLDAIYWESLGDELRKDHFGIEPERILDMRRLPPGKKLPPIKNRAEEVGGDLMMLYAAVYQWASGPTHSAICAARYVDDGDRERHGRRFAGLAVQVASRLAENASRTLRITDGHGKLGAALAEWDSSATRHA